MADLTLADISDALSLVFRPKIQSQINRNVVLLNLLRIKSGHGKVSNWTAKFTGRTNAAGFTEGADMAGGDFDFEKRVDATLNWAQYRKGAKVTGLAQATHATNHSPESAAEMGGSDIFLDEVEDATHRLALGIGQDLYSGDGSAGTPLVGLDLAVLGSGTYATIAPGTYAEHVSSESTSTLAALSLSNLRAWHTKIYKACGQPPEFAITTPEIFDAIGDLFGAERRWMDTVTTAGRGEITLRGGWRGIEVDGITYLRDRFCTAGKIFGLNSNWIEVEELPAYNSPLSYERFARTMMAITSERPPMEAFGEMNARNGGLTPWVDILSRTGDAQKAQVKSYLQLRCTRRNGQGVYTVT